MREFTKSADVGIFAICDEGFALDRKTYSGNWIRFK